MWIETKKYPPPEGVIVDTKIDDGMSDGPCCHLRLIRQGRLWYYTDMKMYVYYEPTHWKKT